MHPRSSWSLPLTAAALATLMMACTSPKKRVAERVAGLDTQWQTNLAYQAQVPERTLDWPTALAQLKAHNLKLAQARSEVTNALESVHQVFRDLTPTLNLHSGLSKNLVDMPSVGPNDVTLSADSFFNIPGLVSFGARLYVTRLYLLRAQAAYALTEREQTIELYKLFWAAQDLQEQAHHLENQKQTAYGFEKVDPFTAQMMLTETELRELSGRRESENLRDRAADVLGSRSYRWRFVTNGLPELHYDLDPLPLTDTNRVARLQIRLAAIELEAARAELAGIKMRYWPELDIFVSGPPIYQRYFGQQTFWDANQLQASADVFWWIDTRGYISRQVRQTKRQQAIQEERLREESLGLISKLLFTQKLIKATQEKEIDLQQELQVLEAVPPAQNLAAMQKYAVDYQTTVDQLRQAQREMAELQSILWFVDERAWPEQPPLQPLADAH